MAKLAIKGHPTRGKKVIEILKMLGGRFGNYEGTDPQYYYTIIDDTITYDCSPNKYKVFSLEEFIKRYPHKVGDKVCFPDDISTPFTINKMWWNSNANELLCSFVEDDIDVPVTGVRAYKEKTLKESIDESFNNTNKTILECQTQCCDIRNSIIKNKETMKDIILDIPKGYEFFGIDDNNKVVLKPIQPQYPQTFDECGKILDIHPARGVDSTFISDITDYEDRLSNLMSDLYKLLICRDAYWKIAGEQMGLGKPWKPDWTKADERKYCIVNTEENIAKWIQKTTNKILAFPTEEMANAFYENFKELINEVKELL